MTITQRKNLAGDCIEGWILYMPQMFWVRGSVGKHWYIRVTEAELCNKWT